jgi:hypothetical protein
VAGFSEQDNKPLGFIKGVEFLDYLSDFLLINNDSAPWN